MLGHQQRQKAHSGHQNNFLGIETISLPAIVRPLDRIMQNMRTGNPPLGNTSRQIVCKKKKATGKKKNGEKKVKIHNRNQ